MKLDQRLLARGVDQHKGVHPKALHVTVVQGHAPVVHQEGELQAPDSQEEEQREESEVAGRRSCASVRRQRRPAKTTATTTASPPRATQRNQNQNHQHCITLATKLA